ncbi:transcriptional regulator Rrf2 family [Clostridium sp. CAG:411]|jgi:Rrf2 family protein|nr:transcriptional regulator Rrf2 family [Clostridium sp. CAG:411]
MIKNRIPSLLVGKQLKVRIGLVTIMKISTKGRYALRLMLDIALNDSERPVRIKEIAERQEMSDKYLEQIVSVLNKAGYLKSIRGPQGGYRLIRKPEEYSVGDILRLTEGSLAPVSCLEYEKNDCPRQTDCVTLELWKRMDQAIKDVVDNVTLADLIEWKQQKGNNYCI